MAKHKGMGTAQAQGKQGKPGNQQVFCNNCKKYGHREKDCRNKNQFQQSYQQKPGKKQLRPCQYCQKGHMDYECPNNPNNKDSQANNQQTSNNPCKRCGSQWYHGHKCEQAQKGGEPSRAYKHCGEKHYDNQCPKISNKSKQPNHATMLCTVCNEGVHMEKNCPLVVEADHNMPAYNQAQAGQIMPWSSMDDPMTGVEEEEEGPQYKDVPFSQGRFESNSPFEFGTWDGTGDDPEILPDAPPLVDEYIPFNGLNYESWQYYRYQEEATRQVRLQQQQRSKPFVYTAPQPFAIPFSNWMSCRY